MKEMKQMKINVFGLSEVRWTSAGQITSDQHLVIYSGGQYHERGVGFIWDEYYAKALKGYWAISKPFAINIIQVYAPAISCSKKVLEDFYEDIERVMKLCKLQRIPSSKVISVPKWEREGLRTSLDLMAWEPRMSVKNIWLSGWNSMTWLLPTPGSKSQCAENGPGEALTVTQEAIWIIFWWKRDFKCTKILQGISWAKLW